jgi:signal transduction histidine kinase
MDCIRLMPSVFPKSLWLRIAIPFLLFVAAGSTALVFWLHEGALREDRLVFAALARTTSDFIRRERVPATERTATNLSQVLGVQVFFAGRDGWDPSAVWLSTEPGPGAAVVLEKAHRQARKVHRESGREAVAYPVSDALDLILLRSADIAAAPLFDVRTLAVLGAFWGLSMTLAWAVARGVVQPLRLLARRLPMIGEDSEATLPGAERADEIGQLARAYLQTRTQLAEERARREQAERLALLGRMATGLAHEIHNPLSAIRMHAQLLGSAPSSQLAVAAADSLPVLLDETARIEGLVNQWMFLAKPAPPQTALVDLREIAGTVLKTYSASAAHAGVTVEMDFPEALPVRADARRLGQAIGNVVLNAIQAMPRGGALCVRGARDSTRAWLEFADTGRGFTPEALTRHGELFFSEREGGMGIGLNVSMEILRAHGGRLEVSNRGVAGPAGMVSPEPGSVTGAVVLLELPVCFP